MTTLLNAHSIESPTSSGWIIDRLGRTIANYETAQRRPTDVRQVILVLHLVTRSRLTQEGYVNVTATDRSREGYRRRQRYQHQKVYVDIRKRSRWIAGQFERVGGTVERKGLQISLRVPQRHPAERRPTRCRNRECSEEVGRLHSSTPPVRHDG